MPKQLICMSKELKNNLVDYISDHATGEQRRTLMTDIEKLPTCPLGFFMRLEEIEKKARRKGKRPKTAYQEFISDCMKRANIKKFGEASSVMKACAAKWQQRKK